MTDENKLILKLDWDKEKTPPPSMADLDNFIGAFKILFEEQKFQTQVEIRSGSWEIIVQCFDMGVTVACDVVLPLIKSAISNPRKRKDKEASGKLAQINNLFYQCTIYNNNSPEEKPISLTPQLQNKTQKLSGVEYQVISHDLEEKTKTHFDKKNLPTPKSHSEKVEAFIEITSGELQGERFRIQTDPNFVERNKVYIASFELKGEKLKMTDKPMLLR